MNEEKNVRMSEWMNDWMNEWMNEWTNEWMYEWMRRVDFKLAASEASAQNWISIGMERLGRKNPLSKPDLHNAVDQTT